MTKGKTFEGMAYAGNPCVRSDEVRSASTITGRRSPLCKMLALVAAACTAFVAVAADTYKYVANGDGTCRLIRLTSAVPQHLVIPDEYEGLAVTALGGPEDAAYYAANPKDEGLTFLGLNMDKLQLGTKLKSVEIPEGVEEIGLNCFAMETALRAVAFPSTLKKIGDWAFMGSGLLVLDLGKTQLESSGFQAFGAMPNLVRAVFPKTLATMGAMSFIWKDNLSVAKKLKYTAIRPLTTVYFMGKTRPEVLAAPWDGGDSFWAEAGMDKVFSTSDATGPLGPKTDRVKNPHALEGVTVYGADIRWSGNWQGVPSKSTTKESVPSEPVLGPWYGYVNDSGRMALVADAEVHLDGFIAIPVYGLRGAPYPSDISVEGDTFGMGRVEFMSDRSLFDELQVESQFDAFVDETIFYNDTTYRWDNAAAQKAPTFAPARELAPDVWPDWMPYNETHEEPRWWIVVRVPAKQSAAAAKQSFTIALNPEKFPNAAPLKVGFTRSKSQAVVTFDLDGKGEAESDGGELVQTLTKGDSGDDIEEPNVTANMGWEFIGWKPALPKTVKGDVTLKAQYRGTVQVNVRLDPAAEAVGCKVTGLPKGDKRYAPGEKVTLKAVPGKGCLFDRWSLYTSLDYAEGSRLFQPDGFDRFAPAISFAVPEGCRSVWAYASFMPDSIYIQVLSPSVEWNAGSLGKIDFVVSSGTTPSVKVTGLPAGLSCNAKEGTITGAPKAPGVYTVTISATNANIKDPVKKTLTITVPNIRSDKIGGITYGTTDYNYTLGAAVGGLRPTAEAGYTLKVSGLPPGLKYDTKTGEITGVPTKTGTSTVTITGTKPGAPNETATITLNVRAISPLAVGTFNGNLWKVDEDGECDWSEPIDGTITLTATAAGKLTAKAVTKEGTYSFSASAWDKVDDSVGKYRVTMATKAGDTLVIVVNAREDEEQPCNWVDYQIEVPDSPTSPDNELRLASGETYKVRAQRNPFAGATAWYFAVGEPDPEDPEGFRLLSYVETAAEANLTVTLKPGGIATVAGKVDGLSVSFSSAVDFSGLARSGGTLRVGGAIPVTVNKVKKLAVVNVSLWPSKSHSEHPDGAGYIIIK